MISNSLTLLDLSKYWYSLMKKWQYFLWEMILYLLSEIIFTNHDQKSFILFLESSSQFIFFISQSLLIFLDWMIDRQLISFIVDNNFFTCHWIICKLLNHNQDDIESKCQNIFYENTWCVNVDKHLNRVMSIFLTDRRENAVFDISSTSCALYQASEVIFFCWTCKDSLLSLWCSIIDFTFVFTDSVILISLIILIIIVTVFIFVVIKIVSDVKCKLFDNLFIMSDVWIMTENRKRTEKNCRYFDCHHAILCTLW